MDRHLTIAAVLLVASGIISLVVTMISIPAVIDLSNHSDHAPLQKSVLPFLFTAGFLLCVWAIVGGIGLFQRKRWARTAMLVFAPLAMLNIPIGTILGIYYLWVLTKPETMEMLS